MSISHTLPYAQNLGKKYQRTVWEKYKQLNSEYLEAFKAYISNRYDCGACEALKLAESNRTIVYDLYCEILEIDDIETPRELSC
jgi:cytochrome c-type biogenesis protein CcmH/NrfF